MLIDFKQPAKDWLADAVQNLGNFLADGEDPSFTITVDGSVIEIRLNRVPGVFERCSMEVVDTAVWVPVTERLPSEEDGTVAVFCDDGSILTAWATYWHGASSEFAQWTFPAADDEPPTVTHWAYLPKVPA